MLPRLARCPFRPPPSSPPCSRSLLLPLRSGRPPLQAFFPYSTSVMPPHKPLIPEWERVANTASKPYYMFTMPIHKSRNDDRDYRIVQLDNGLQAMVVHDAKADKAAASLDVSVGHLYDPVSPHPPYTKCMAWSLHRSGSVMLSAHSTDATICSG